MRKKKTKNESSKSTVLSVAREMAKPRMAESVRKERDAVASGADVPVQSFSDTFSQRAPVSHYQGNTRALG